MAKIEFREKETKLKETAVEERKTIDPMAKFDTNYKADKLTELYDKYDKLSADEDKDIEFETPSIVRKHVEKVKAKQMTFSQKLSVGVASIVVALLMFLAIFNIVVINNTQNSIKLANEEIAQTELNLGKTADALNEARKNNDRYEKLKDAYQADETSNYAIASLEKINVDTISVSGNWFDSLCNFFSNMFGG